MPHMQRGVVGDWELVTSFWGNLEYWGKALGLYPEGNEELVKAF